MRGVGMHRWPKFLSVLTFIALAVSGVQAQVQPATPKRSITLAEAIEIFMRQNLELVAARYDIEIADENEAPFTEVVNHTADLVKAGEMSALDLDRVEVEKLKFDTDLANAERDYEVALRDLRFALGGDYRTMDVEITGSIDYEPHQFTHDEQIGRA